MIKQHCPGCGRKSRLRWPKESPEFCSKECAADAALAQLSASLDNFHCPLCGEVGCQRSHDTEQD